MYNFHKFAVVPVRLDVCHGPARGGVHWRRLFVLLSHGSLFGAARGACVAAAELLARRLRAVNARLETPPWLSCGAEKCRSARRRFGARLRAVNGCERSLHAAARAFKRRDDAPRPAALPSLLVSLQAASSASARARLRRGVGLATTALCSVTPRPCLNCGAACNPRATLGRDPGSGVHYFCASGFGRAPARTA